MKKKLCEMSVEELWQLFPIFLTEHQDCWAGWYGEEKAVLASILPPETGIHHIGSTAVKGIWAKPIIDILAEVPGKQDLAKIGDRLTEKGYLCMSRSGERISMNKGYTENGFAERVFHIHLRYFGDNDELYFRDFLNEHPETARSYERMKLELWKKFEHDRDGYTEAKTEFVRNCTEKAKAAYGNRYRNGRLREFPRQ